MSETDWGDICGDHAGEMGAGLWLSQKIIKDFNTLSPSAWILWQTIDYHKSENGYMGNSDFGIPDVNKGYWGLAFADHDTENIILTKKYYCMGQFSRYINVSDTIIFVGDDALCAFNDKEVKLVVINCKSSETPVKIDLKDMNKTFSNVKRIRTSGNMISGENWAELSTETVINNIYETKLKANSVTTYIFK